MREVVSFQLEAVTNLFLLRRGLPKQNLLPWLDEWVWKVLWKMQVPNKIKAFAWRACKDCLPSKDNLIKKQVLVDALCSFCLHPVEDLYHPVFSCCGIQVLWKQLLPSVFPCDCSKVLYIAMQLVEGKEFDNMGLFFCLAWGFWYRRNKWEFDKTKLSPNQVINNAMGLLHSYKEVRPKTHVQLQHHLSWSPPPVAVLKLNTDRTMFTDLHQAGLGVILRDATYR